MCFYFFECVKGGAYILSLICIACGLLDLCPLGRTDAESDRIIALDEVFECVIDNRRKGNVHTLRFCGGTAFELGVEADGGDGGRHRRWSYVRDEISRGLAVWQMYDSFSYVVSQLIRR